MDPLEPDEVARRLSGQPGLRLITYREVGLPFWEVPLECRLLAKKPMPALEEFVLKCVSADLRKDNEIAEFLGLPARVVSVVMASLLNAGHLVPRKDDTENSVTFGLTVRGRSALTELSEVVAEQSTVSLSYDGLLRAFTLVEQSQRWRPRDLRDNDILEVPAFPADPPEMGPSDTPAVSRLLSQIPRLAQHELLSVLGLAGKREKFFLRAVAMVFESLDVPGDYVVKFAVDGRLSEEHDHAFARAEGQRKMGIVDSLRSMDAPAESLLDPAVLKQRSDNPEIGALRRATESLRNRLAEVEERAVHTDDDVQRDELSRQVDELQGKLDDAEAALSRVPARLLEVHEHPGLLAEALASAQERLLIVSPWIRSGVVNAEFLRDLEILLNRGVEVGIAYGIDDNRVANQRDSHAEQELAALAGRHTNFRLVRLGDTHAKVLVVDRRFVVVTSFNWLSFRGDPRRPFRDERGTLVAISAEINRIYDDYSTRMATSLLAQSDARA